MGLRARSVTVVRIRSGPLSPLPDPLPLAFVRRWRLDRDCGSAPSGVMRETAVIRQRPETESRGCSPRPSTVSWGTSSPLVCPLPLFFAPCPRARRELWERAVGGVVRGCGDPTAPRDRFSRVQSAAVVRDLGDLKSGTNAFGGGTSARFGPPRAAWWEHGWGIAGLLKWDSNLARGGVRERGPAPWTGEGQWLNEDARPAQRAKFERCEAGVGDRN